MPNVAAAVAIDNWLLLPIDMALKIERDRCSSDHWLRPFDPTMALSRRAWPHTMLARNRLHVQIGGKKAEGLEIVNERSHVRCQALAPVVDTATNQSVSQSNAWIWY